jgi:tetratricopeptide (TPR) repeat protein
MKAHLKARSCVLLLVFVVLGVYYPAIFSPFNSVDDPGMVNYLLNADTFSLREMFAPGGAYYRPILLLSFIADKYLWGLQESFMHLENVVFHLLNVLLLFAVARRCAPSDEARCSLLPLTAALLFALHPINTEAVNWISGRTDLLCCFFILLSTWLMLRRTASLPATLTAALCLLAACLAKETAIFFLPAAVILPFFLEGAEGKRRSVRATSMDNWPHLLIFSAAGAGFFLFRSLASSHGDAGVSRVVSYLSGSQSAGASVNLRLPLKAAGFYLKKLFVPFPLNFGIIHVSDLYLPVGVFLCLFMVWLLTRRTLTAFLFICAASISCSALMIPLLNLTWAPLAERYMYVPSAFFVLGMACAVERWEHRARFQPLITGAACTILVIACYGTASRTLLWQDNLALFRDTLRKSPGFVPAQNEIAVALYARGEKRESAAILGAMQLPANLINYQYGLISKSVALAQNGDLEGAEAMLNRALKDPGKCEVDICRRLLALYDLKAAKGTKDSAQVYPGSVRLLSRLYQLSGNPFYLYRLGIKHMTQKERRLARESFRSAAAKAPPGAVYRLPAMKLSEKLSD